MPGRNGKTLGVGGFGHVYELFLQTASGMLARRLAFQYGDGKKRRIEYGFSEIIGNAMQRMKADCKAANPGKAANAIHCCKRLGFGIRLVEEKTRIGNCAIGFEQATCDVENIAFHHEGPQSRPGADKMSTARSGRYGAKVGVDWAGVSARARTYCSQRHEAGECTVLRDKLRHQNRRLWNRPRLESESFAVLAMQMAAEIWLNNMRANGKSDVFSLAVTLYEVFEGTCLVDMCVAPFAREYGEYPMRSVYALSVSFTTTFTFVLFYLSQTTSTA